MPEALVNGLGLLGWNPPQREDPEVLAADISVLAKSEVMELEEMEQLFDIDKIGKSGVKFDEKKLEFLNSMHIRNKFIYFEDESEKKEAIDEWRKVLLNEMPN